MTLLFALLLDTSGCGLGEGGHSDALGKNGSDAAGPTSTERCNGLDDDGDGEIDESDAIDASTWYIDADGDTYGSARSFLTACIAPDGYVGDSTDCTDEAAEIHPGADEACNGTDDNCDGEIDESGAIDTSIWYIDVDGDSFGSASTSVNSCSAPDGYVANSTDCADETAEIHPGADESCNGTDDDCDGEIDEDVVTATADIDLPEVLTVSTDDGATLTFDGIGAGCFQMGCTPEQSTCGSDEFPVNTVHITRPFYIGRTELTQEQYLSLTGLSPSYFDGAELPVEWVDWDMSAAAANALSRLEGLEECYICVGSGASVECEGAADPYGCGGYRLPTEAEWEHAARCGEGTEYSGSDDVDEVAWTPRNSGSTTHEVGGLLPNGCGLYDMSGNVWEWTNDGYGGYSEGVQSDPVGATDGSVRVFRGGGWDESILDASVANRSAIGVAAHRDYLGLRLARTIP